MIFQKQRSRFWMWVADKAQKFSSYALKRATRVIQQNISNAVEYSGIVQTQCQRSDVGQRQVKLATQITQERRQMMSTRINKRPPVVWDQNTKRKNDQPYTGPGLKNMSFMRVQQPSGATIIAKGQTAAEDGASINPIEIV